MPTHFPIQLSPRTIFFFFFGAVFFFFSKNTMNLTLFLIDHNSANTAPIGSILPPFEPAPDSTPRDCGKVRLAPVLELLREVGAREDQVFRERQRKEGGFKLRRADKRRADARAKAASVAVGCCCGCGCCGCVAVTVVVAVAVAVAAWLLWLCGCVGSVDSAITVWIDCVAV
jgi:hypothetical protein